MNRHIRLLVPALAMMLASGCLTTYRLPPGKPAASLRVAPEGMTWVCNKGERQLLRAGRDGRVAIPADSRVTIGVSYVLAGNYTRETCEAATSIVPTTDARYYQDFEYEGGRCKALVYKETEDRRVGLAFEPTLGRPDIMCLR